MTTTTTNNNTREGKMTFESGQVQVTRYGTVKDLGLGEDDLVFAPIVGQPTTKKVRTVTDFLSRAIEEKKLINGDEVVIMKVGQHKKVRFEITLGAVDSQKETPEEDEDEDEETPEEDEDDGDDV